MAEVFISYVRENKTVVDRLVQDLEREDVQVWIDRKKLRPGYRWPYAIRQAILEGDFFIACFSDEYYARSSTHMNEELTIAIEELRRRPIDMAWFIPVRLSQCIIPDRSIGGGDTLRSLQCVDLFTDWKHGVERILSVIRPQPQPIQTYVPKKEITKRRMREKEAIERYEDLYTYFAEHPGEYRMVRLQDDIIGVYLIGPGGGSLTEIIMRPILHERICVYYFHGIEVVRPELTIDNNSIREIINKLHLPPGIFKYPPE